MDRLERILANFSFCEHEHRCMYMQDPDMGQQTTDFDVRSREMQHVDNFPMVYITACQEHAYWPPHYEKKFHTSIKNMSCNTDLKASNGWRQKFKARKDVKHLC